MNQPLSQPYSPLEATRAELEALSGAVLLDFGTNWCGVCARTRPLIEAALAAHPAVRHIKVEDGPGRRLGRIFGVKLWPTLVLLKDGREAAKLVRPQDEATIATALAGIDA